MVDDTLDIATVASEEGIAVGLVIGVGGRVVRGVAIGETVGHEQVHHVGRGEAGALGRAFAACLQLVGVAELLALLGEYEIVGAGLCLGIDGDVDKQVVGTLGLVYLGYLHALAALDGEVVGGDVGTMNHQLQGSAHAGPPGERLHAVYGIAHGAVLPTPGSLKLYRYLYFVAWYRAGKGEGVVVGADNLKLAMPDACAQGRIAMLEGDEVAVEVGMRILLPCRDGVFLEELEAVVPSHLLTGIDERLSARQGEGEHGHGLRGVAHTLKFGAGPGVLVVVGDEHEAVGTFGVALGVLLDIGYQVVDALVALGDIVHHVVQLPRVGGVEPALALQERFFALGEHEDIGVLCLDVLDGLFPEGEGHLASHIATEAIDTTL